MARTWIALLGLGLLVFLGCTDAQSAATAPAESAAASPAAKALPEIELLNVSYDPTRELYQALNAKFEEDYYRRTGQEVTVRQSHGGSTSQARAVIDGLEADVVTLALWSDVDAIRAAGLIQPGWESRLPRSSIPYYSTIVFIVRKGNPQGIHDWTDLVQPGVEIITPNPKTGGGAKLNFLAAWLSVIARGGSDEEAQKFVTQLYRQVPVLDSGARGSATTFAQKKIGDVHLAWENEAYREVSEQPNELEIVYPSVSLIAEPSVAVVDAVVDHKGTRDAAIAYLEYLYTPAAQEVIASQYYRPTNEDVWAKHSAQFPTLELRPITVLANDWQAAFDRFFAEGAIYDRIQQKIAQPQ